MARRTNYLVAQHFKSTHPGCCVSEYHEESVSLYLPVVAWVLFVLVENVGVMCGWCLTLRNEKIALGVGFKEQCFYVMMCAQGLFIRKIKHIYNIIL